MSNKARKRVNAACRKGETAHQQYGRSRPARRVRRSYSPNFVAALLEFVGPSWDENGVKIPLGAVSTPEDCAGCLHRQEDWRDGGWCYMFREMPSPTCTQFKRDSILVVGQKKGGTHA